MKHLKTLGQAGLAVTALTAVVGVTSASAAEFHAGAGVALTGVQVEAETFTIEGSSVTCNTVVWNGTAAASGTSATQNMHPEYSSCKAFGFTGATINTAGCQYGFNGNTTTMNVQGCTGGITIDVTSAFGNCHVNIANQTGLNGVTFTNMGSTGNGDATTTVTLGTTNFVVTVNVSTGICPILVGTKNSATHNGRIGIMGPNNTPQTHLG
jgi:hypothetical protein